MKVLYGIQARSNSTRFPGKIYEEILGRSVLERVYETCRRSLRMSRIIEKDVRVLGPWGDKRLERYCTEKCIPLLLIKDVAEDDLVGRYLASMELTEAEYVIRVTSDCPMLPPLVLDGCLSLLAEADYVSNCIYRTYPEGWDVQGISRKGMAWVDQNQIDEREHPFYGLDENSKDRNQFVQDGLTWKPLVDQSSIILRRTSIDTREDLNKLRKIYEQRVEK